MKIKKFASLLITSCKLSGLGFYLQKKILGSDFIRVINYHDTPSKTSDNLEKQMIYFAKNYSPVSIDDLEKFFKTKKWHKKKPGLIISFDDGLKSNFETALPLLEKYGFAGWFFITPGFINSKNKSVFAKNNSIIAQFPDTSSWKELKNAAKKHIIASHTMNHKRFGNILLSELKYELNTSKDILEKNLGKKIKCFAWVGGELKNYTKQAAKEIKNAGYEFVFQTNSALITKNTKKQHLQRTNIESSYPLYLVKFQLSGIMDILYWPKRKIVESITK
ncbi:MAG: polysaccharide deacetylase family protein [Candidatus Muiribacteriota bacterium]